MQEVTQKMCGMAMASKLHRNQLNIAKCVHHPLHPHVHIIALRTTAHKNRSPVT